AEDADVELEQSARIPPREEDREEGDHTDDDEGGPEEDEHDEVRDRQQPLDEPEAAAEIRRELAGELERIGSGVVHLSPLCRRSGDGYGRGFHRWHLLRFRDAQKRRDPLRHPPVRSAEQLHERRNEEAANDRGVEDDPRRQADRERLDLVTRARRENDEREHENQGGARHELAGARETELDRLVG